MNPASGRLWPRKRNTGDRTYHFYHLSTYFVILQRIVLSSKILRCGWGLVSSKVLNPWAFKRIGFSPRLCGSSYYRIISQGRAFSQIFLDWLISEVKMITAVILSVVPCLSARTAPGRLVRLSLSVHLHYFVWRSVQSNLSIFPVRVICGREPWILLDKITRWKTHLLTDRLIDLTASPQVKMGKNWPLPFSDKMLRKLQSRKCNGWTTVLKTNIWQKRQPVLGDVL